MLKSTQPYTIFVALGSNLGSGGLNSAETIKYAIQKLDSTLGGLIQSSGVYRTPCFPAGAGPDFANAVVELETLRRPEDCLEVLHRIEAEFGRTREVRWDARTLDLDLLDHNCDVLPDLTVYKSWSEMPLEAQKTQTPDQLILPHPRLQDRGFVLVPWAEIAPDWCHPVLGKTIAQMSDALPQSELSEITLISKV